MITQGYVVSSRMGDVERPNTGLRFERLGSMKGLIEGLLMTQDSITLRVGTVTVAGSSYREIHDQLDQLLPRNTSFLD